MKDYFKRLKDHPGVGYGLFFPILGALAGASNKSFILWQGALFGFTLTFILCWMFILTSNGKR